MLKSLLNQTQPYYFNSEIEKLLKTNGLQTSALSICLSANNVKVVNNSWLIGLVTREDDNIIFESVSQLDKIYYSLPILYGDDTKELQRYIMFIINCLKAYILHRNELDRLGNVARDHIIDICNDLKRLNLTKKSNC